MPYGGETVDVSGFPEEWIDLGNCGLLNHRVYSQLCRGLNWYETELGIEKCSGTNLDLNSLTSFDLVGNNPVDEDFTTNVQRTEITQYTTWIYLEILKPIHDKIYTLISPPSNGLDGYTGLKYEDTSSVDDEFLWYFTDSTSILEDFKEDLEDANLYVNDFSKKYLDQTKSKVRNFWYKWISSLRNAMDSMTKKTSLEYTQFYGYGYPIPISREFPYVNFILDQKQSSISDTDNGNGYHIVTFTDEYVFNGVNNYNHCPDHKVLYNNEEFKDLILTEDFSNPHLSFMRYTWNIRTFLGPGYPFHNYVIYPGWHWNENDDETQCDARNSIGSFLTYYLKNTGFSGSYGSVNTYNIIFTNLIRSDGAEILEDWELESGDSFNVEIQPIIQKSGDFFFYTADLSGNEIIVTEQDNNQNITLDVKCTNTGLEQPMYPENIYSLDFQSIGGSATLTDWNISYSGIDTTTSPIDNIERFIVYKKPCGKVII